MARRVMMRYTTSTDETCLCANCHTFGVNLMGESLNDDENISMILSCGWSFAPDPPKSFEQIVEGDISYNLLCPQCTEDMDKLMLLGKTWCDAAEYYFGNAISGIVKTHGKDRVEEAMRNPYLRQAFRELVKFYKLLVVDARSESGPIDTSTIGDALKAGDEDEARFIESLSVELVKLEHAEEESE